MHVPDGFIDAPTSVAAGALAAGAVAVSLRGSRRELGGAERTAPLAGLVAAFVFAVQMLNFPVAAGTSGHLLGGALAAVLVGPYTGVLCIAVVLLLQAVLFADGGLTALGVNILDMGVITVLVAYGLFRALIRVLPRGRGAVTASAFAAALVSVPAAAVAFWALYALGGTTDVPLGKVFAAMVGVHVLIGLGEAAITALTVGAVAAVRPDLVYAARDRLAVRLELRTSPAGRTAAGAAPEGAAAPWAGTGSVPAPEAGPGAGPAPARESGPEPAPAPRPATAPAPEAGAGSGAGSAGGPGAAGSAAPRSARTLWLAGLAVALVCAGGISFYASADPDGLEKVASDNGIDEKEKEHAAKDSPLADYGVGDIADTRLSVGLAGAIGVGATLAVGSGVFVALRRRTQPERAERARPSSSSTP